MQDYGKYASKMRAAIYSALPECERRRFAANLGIAGIPKAAECANLHLTASKRRPPEGNSPPLCSANRLGSPPVGRRRGF